MPEVGDRGGLLHVVKNTCSKPPNEIKPKELFELYFRLRYLVHYWLRPELAKRWRTKSEDASKKGLCRRHRLVLDRLCPEVAARVSLSPASVFAPIVLAARPPT